jgi:hypothetical protein
MQDLRVNGVENGALLATAEDGTRYRIPIDEETQSLLRRRSPVGHGERRVAPREVQAHIRAGMSAQDVAELTGASIDYIEKFEGPVLAERQFIVSAALSVPVNTASDADPLNGATFGTVMAERLIEIGADDSTWASWKDAETGWIVKLEFTADDIGHDARWQFDPKRATLAPINGDATRLSQQGEITGSLIPRLRAVPGDERAPDTTRFDSGAFSDEQLSKRDTAPYAEAIPFARGPQAVSPEAINRDASENAAESGHTADLLEALRRRRGVREAAPVDDAEESRAAHPSTGSIRVIDIPLDDFDDADDAPRDADRPQPVPSIAAKPQKKGRASMPSWDDIVFGAKSDEE